MVWQKGQSGNPKGRPRGQTLTGMMRKALAANNDKQAQEIVATAIEQAKNGRFSHFQEILNRVDGTLVNRIRLEREYDRWLDVAERVLEPAQYAVLVEALANEEEA